MEPGGCSLKSLWIFNHHAGFPEHVPTSRTYDLARLLVQMGWQVTVIASGFVHHTHRYAFDFGKRSVLHMERNGVRFVFLKTMAYRNDAQRLAAMLSYYWHARRWASAQVQAPDAVVGTCVHPFAVEAARRVAAVRGAAFFYEIADLWPESLVDLGVMGRKHPLYRLLFAMERAAYRSARGVVGLVPGVPDYVREFHGMRIARFCLAPNGLAQDQIPPEPTVAPVRGRVVYAGGFARAHGMQTILEAARLLDRSDPGIQFDLYGDGDGRTSLEREAEGLRNVRFRGWVPKTRIAEEIASAEMFLCTARPMAVHRFGTNFNKLFDDFAAARPVVFAVESRNNPVAEAKAGLSVPPGDAEALAMAIRRIHGLPAEEREAMGRAGRKYLLEHHVRETIADRLSAFLASTVEEAA